MSAGVNESNPAPELSELPAWGTMGLKPVKAMTNVLLGGRGAPRGLQGAHLLTGPQCLLYAGRPDIHLIRVFPPPKKIFINVKYLPSAHHLYHYLRARVYFILFIIYIYFFQK